MGGGGGRIISKPLGEAGKWFMGDTAYARGMRATITAGGSEVLPWLGKQTGQALEKYSGVKAMREGMEKSEANRIAENEAAIEENKKKQAEFEATQAQEEAELKAGGQRNTARARQRSQMMAARGRRDTILTGPLGVPNEPTFTGKTLLGV